MIKNENGGVVRFETEAEYDAYLAEKAALTKAYNDYAEGKVHGGDMPSTQAVDAPEIARGEISVRAFAF